VGHWEAAAAEAAKRFEPGSRAARNIAAAVADMDNKGRADGTTGCGIWAPADLDGQVVGYFELQVWPDPGYRRIGPPQNHAAPGPGQGQGQGQGKPTIVSQRVKQVHVAGHPAVLARQNCLDASDQAFLRTTVAYFPTWGHDQVRLEVVCADNLRQEQFEQDAALIAGSLILNGEGDLL
jgi:hypothetical protein